MIECLTGFEGQTLCFFYLYLIWWDGFMPNRNNLFYDAVNTVAHSHINCACNNAYRNIYQQFCGTSRHRPPLSLFFPPLQICYDTAPIFFVGSIFGRPLICIPHHSSFCINKKKLFCSKFCKLHIDKTLFSGIIKA